MKSNLEFMTQDYKLFLAWDSVKQRCRPLIEWSPCPDLSDIHVRLDNMMADLAMLRQSAEEFSQNELLDGAISRLLHPSGEAPH
jgi:hypothetical protein